MSAGDFPDRIAAMPQIACPRRPPAKLGYRGLTLVLTTAIGRDMQVEIEGGVLRLETTCRDDVGRQLERALLETGVDVLGADRLARILTDLR